MHDGCATKQDLESQSNRHHEALNRITATTAGMQATMETIKDLLVGSFERPGLGYRLTALEARAKVNFWQDVGMAAARAVAVFLVVVVLFGIISMGFRATIKDMIKDTANDVTMARKAPKDPSCPGCAPTVADAR